MKTADINDIIRAPLGAVAAKPRRNGALQSTRPLLLALLLLAGYPIAHAQVLTFTVPGKTLNTQAIGLQVFNPGAPLLVGSLEFFIELPIAGPKIQSVDLVGGTIFEANYTGPFTIEGNTSYLQYYTIMGNWSLSSPELPSGLSTIASVVFDTIDVASGVYALKLTGTGFGDSMYMDPMGVPLALSIENATLHVVPEPEQYAVVIALALLITSAGRRLRPWASF
jgi:hypothetical protein